jgi:hypothetical protein
MLRSKCIKVIWFVGAGNARTHVNVNVNVGRVINKGRVVPNLKKTMWKLNNERKASDWRFGRPFIHYTHTQYSMCIPVFSIFSIILKVYMRAIQKSIHFSSVRIVAFTKECERDMKENSEREKERSDVRLYNI